MRSWVKFFKDGSPEIGTDQAIEDGLASWSRGRLSDITKVQLSNRLLAVTVQIPDTDWHQFDRYHVCIGDDKCSAPIRVARVIQAQVQKKHIGQYLLYNKSTYLVRIDPHDEGKGYKITENNVGKWITVQIRDSQVSWHFSEKGKLNGN